MGLVINARPVCEITGGGKTAATISERLISAEVVDAAGVESDSARIEIDAGGLDVWPDTGQVIGVTMGYKDGGARLLGEFKLSKISESMQPNILTLSFTAAPFEANDPTEFKKRRSATYEAATVGDIVKGVAERHGFSPRVHADLAGIVIDHVDQNDETDIRFLSRLAKRFDAACKPAGKLLVFGRHGQLKSLSGKTLEPVVIEYPGDKSPADVGFTNASLTGGDRHKYSGVAGWWHDGATAENVEVTLGDPPRKKLRNKFTDANEANQFLEAEYRRMGREGDKISIDCPGNAKLMAEGLAELQAFPSGRANGEWSADRVTHSYRRNSGYRCRVEATVPQK